jgi:DNA-binding NarL/FixJ family response regulator
VEETRALLERAGYPTLAAADGQEAVQIAAEHRPDVVLLEIQLPGLNGYETCRALRDAFGRALGIVFISGKRTAGYDISAGLLVGADDYLIKPCDTSELVARVGAVVRRVRHEREDGAGFRRLTRREIEVLRHLSNGLGQREIADMLTISPKTVGIHIEHILGKLNVRSRAQAVAVAYRENLVVMSEL